MIRFKCKDITHFIPKDSIMDAVTTRENYSVLLNLRKDQLLVYYENEEQFSRAEFLLYAYLTGGERWIDISPEEISKMFCNT